MGEPTAEELADALEKRLRADEELDAFEELDAMKASTPAEVFAELALMFDVCPEHVCDIDICRDDQRDCAGTRAWTE
jgi:hypothetical protein